MNIHPSAIVHPKANVGEDVAIGPYCVVGEHVRIGDQTELLSHVCIDGHTEIGRCCRLFPFVSIGTPPQHLQYKNEPTKVSIGDHNIIRENVTINRGTAFGSGITRIGHHNFLMAYTHVAHDCELGNHIIMANAANLAGHVSVGNSVVIGGLVGVHQYARIGEYAMVGGCSALGRDVPPFVRAAGGYRAQMFGLNTIALRRHGFSAVRMATLKAAFDLLFRQGHRLQEAIKLARNEYGESTDVLSLLTFLESTSRGICQVASRELNDDEE